MSASSHVVPPAPSLTSILVALKTASEKKVEAVTASAPPTMASEPALPRNTLAASGGRGPAARFNQRGGNNRPRFSEAAKAAHNAAKNDVMNVEDWCSQYLPHAHLIRRLVITKATAFYSPENEKYVNSLLKKLDALLLAGSPTAITNFELPHHSAAELKEYHAKCVDVVQTMLNKYQLFEQQQAAMQQQLFQQQQQQQAMQQQAALQAEQAMQTLQSLAAMSGGGSAPLEPCYFHFHGGGCSKVECPFSHQ